jgi:phage terminase large subunit
MAKNVKLPEIVNIDIDSRVFNPKFYPYLTEIYEYEIYFGGQGSGKSHFVTQKKALQLTTMPDRNMICLRKQSTDCFDSCWGQMITAIEQLKLEVFWDIRHSDHRMTNRINGNGIYFDGVDQIGNIKSFKPEHGNLTDVWYEEVDEEREVGSIRIIDGRIRDQFQKCSLILSFNPVHREHWLYNYIYTELKNADALVVHSTHWDNMFCSAAYHQKTEALKYTDPYRYQVYGLGEWGVSGQTVFNANKITQRLSVLQELHTKNPPRRIEFAFERDANGLPNRDSFRLFPFDDGETWVYKEPNPKHPYVLSIDTAGEGVDWFAAHVIDNINGEQVAVFHSTRAPDVCVLQLFGLAKYYNTALIVPEINFDGSYLLNKFQELGYNNIYQRTKPSDSYSDGYEQKLGFRTTSENRTKMLQVLKDWTEEHMACINDVATLNEMITFTRQAKKLKGIWWGAEAGAHDDLIMALAIGLQGREQQDCEEIPEHVELKGFFFPEELENHLKDKTMSYSDVFEYRKKSNIFGEKYVVQKKGNRYDR